MRLKAVLTAKTGWPSFLAREACLQIIRLKFHKSTVGVLGLSRQRPDETLTPSRSTLALGTVDSRELSVPQRQDGESVDIPTRDPNFCADRMDFSWEIPHGE